MKNTYVSSYWALLMLCTFLASPAAAQDLDTEYGDDQDEALEELDSGERYETAAEYEDADDLRSARNIINIELLGNGGVYTLNYHRFLTDDVTLRVGASFFSFSAATSAESASATVFFAPIMVNYLGIGGLNHKLELGIGLMIGYASAAVSGAGGGEQAEGIGVGGTATVGYRYVPRDGGFTFNIGFTPIFGRGGFLPWPGIGAGAVF